MFDLAKVVSEFAEAKLVGLIFKISLSCFTVIHLKNFESLVE